MYKDDHETRDSDYLLCICIVNVLSLEFRIFILFYVCFQTLCSFLNPYRHHSLRYSWEIRLVFFCFSVSIQINHEKNLKIYVLCGSCKREMYSKLSIKTPLLLFWCLIVNVSIVNLNRYLSAGIMIFQLKKLYSILRTEILFCWESKIIINFSNKQIPEPDLGTLRYLRQRALWQLGGIESTEGSIGRSIQNLCHTTYFYE